jgi:antitoxin component YwqK of YwqJK toxin-antitoxin module
VQPPTDVCLKLGPASVKEIVGTFKDGTLEGVAKITYLDGHKIIANYKNGIVYGHRRDWNSNGTLVQVTYYNQFHMSPSWNSYGNYLVFSDTTKIKFEDGNENDFDFVFDISRSKAYIGTLINPLQDERVLMDIHEVDLVEDSFNIKSCLPRPDLKIKSKADYLLLLKYDKKIDLGQQKTCSSVFTEKNKDVESVFYSWLRR